MGALKIAVERERTPSASVKLLSLGTPGPLTATLGTYRVDIQQEPPQAAPGDRISYRLKVLDPDGKVKRIHEDKIKWRSETSPIQPSRRERPRGPQLPPGNYRIGLGPIEGPVVICIEDGTCVGGLHLLRPKPKLYQSIASGYDFSCALDTDGQVWCWGDDSELQLGYPDNVYVYSNAPYMCGVLPCSLTPVPVSGGNKFQSITAGFNFACGIDTSGVAWCWGADDWGELGVTGGPIPPQEVGGAPFGSAHKFLSLSAGGNHACGVTTDHLLFCWGSNQWGELGIGSPNPTAPPTQVNVANRQWIAVAAGTLHTCAITSNSAMFCWGNDDSGELGIDFTTTPTDRCTIGPNVSFCKRTPVQVQAGAGGVPSGSWDLVSAGTGFTCGRDANGAKTYCWGGNVNGELGNGSTSTSPGPYATPVSVSTTLVVLSSHFSHTCAGPLNVGPGTTVCWGADPLFPPSFAIATPTSVPNNVFLGLAPGGVHTCALDNNSAAWCWGLGFYGNLGDGSTADSRVPVPVSW
jgi:alpha-tubulin suppressor-like RCC1 family protein